MMKFLVSVIALVFLLDIPLTFAVTRSQAGSRSSAQSRKPRVTPLPSVVNFSLLSTWTRASGNPIFGGTSGDFAADPHVWEESPGVYYMVYTTDFGGAQAIGMARSTNLLTWTPITSPQYGSQYVIRGNGPAAGQNNQETAVHLKTASGQHQIYYIGYDNELVYAAQIYRATASSVEGPYTRESAPVIPFGAPGSYDDGAMTSPTIVEHEGKLYMVYIAWDDIPSGAPNVINAGAISTDDGVTWAKSGKLDWSGIFGVEAHIEKGPDGKFYRVGTETPAGSDVLSVGVASHPFGVYTKLASVLTLGGASVGEVDSITGGTLLFNTNTRRVYMYYSAVAAGGFPWMTSLATAPYQ